MAVSKKNQIYKITINNWEKYNAKSKPGHPSVLISKRFFDDVTIQRLPSGGKLLWLGLILRRGDVKETFFEASHEDLVRFAGGSGQVVERLLDLLQSLQLLTYEKTTLNIKEKKADDGKKNLKAPKISDNSKPEAQEPTVGKPPVVSKSQLFISKYCRLFKARYGTNPEMAGKNAGIAERISKNLSEEKIEIYLEAFFRMPDSGLIKSKHPLSFFELKLNEIVVFANSGAFTTQTQARQIDQSASTFDMLQQIREGKL